MADPQFRPRRFGHANLFISDVHRSMEFYNRVVGLEECFQEPAIYAGFMSNGNTHHDVGLTQLSEESLIGRDGQMLVPSEFGRQPGLFHLAFEMENEAELVAAHERAVEFGVQIIMTVDHTLAKSVYLLDAERNMLEFTSDSTKDWRAMFRDLEGTLVTGPWTPGVSTPSRDRNYPVDPELARVEKALVQSRLTTHAALGCADLALQLAFYREVGGFNDVIYSEDAGLAVLRGTAAPYSLVLYQAGGEQAAGYHHMAFEVTEADLESAEPRLRDAGIEIAARRDHPAKRSLFVRDPDGLGVEFYAARDVPPAGLSPAELREFWLVAA